MSTPDETSPSTRTDAEVARHAADVLGDLERCAHRLGVKMPPERLSASALRIARDELGLTDESSSAA